MNPLSFAQFSLVPVRQIASDTAEMVTQLLFGERVERIGEERNWVKIRVWEDQYEGWVDSKMLCPLPRAFENENQWKVLCKSGLILERKGKQVQRWLHLPIGSRIPVEAGENPSVLEIGDEILDFSTLGRDGNIFSSPESVLSAAEGFLGAPYLWGGKSLWGMDCSGLVQLSFRLMGKKLPRDAAQQALVGQGIDFAELAEGDLAFLGKESSRITHVGIADGKGGIIHASGSVRRDFLKESGIIHAETGLLTHHLRLVKRIR